MPADFGIRGLAVLLGFAPCGFKVLVECIVVERAWLVDRLGGAVGVWRKALFLRGAQWNYRHRFSFRYRDWFRRRFTSSDLACSWLRFFTRSEATADPDSRARASAEPSSRLVCMLERTSPTSRSTVVLPPRWSKRRASSSRTEGVEPC